MFICTSCTPYMYIYICDAVKAFEESKKVRGEERVRARARFTRVHKARIKFQLKALYPGCAPHICTANFYFQVPFVPLFSLRRPCFSIALCTFFTFFFCIYHARMFRPIDPPRPCYTILKEIKLPIREEYRYLRLMKHCSES